MKQTRMANLELLRCIAMGMVITLHFLGKGGLLGDLTKETLPGTVYAAYFLESLSVVAVNIYMLISGYFLCTANFRLTKVISFLLQVFTYSVIFGVGGAMLGFAEPDLYYYLHVLLPISMNQYWFATAYFLLLLFSPVIGKAAMALTKAQLKVTILLLLLFLSLPKSFAPFVILTDDNGYSFVWFMVLLFVATYIRRFGCGIVSGKKLRAAFVYILFTVLIYVGVFTYRWIYLKTGKMVQLIDVTLDYNHIFTVLAAIGLFCLFLQLDVKGRYLSGLVRFAGPLTFGVYLMHESIGLRYKWPEFFRAGEVSSIPELFIALLIAVGTVFIAGIFVELLRKQCMQLLHKGLLHLKPYRVIYEKIVSMEGSYAQK